MLITELSGVRENELTYVMLSKEKKRRDKLAGIRIKYFEIYFEHVVTYTAATLCLVYEMYSYLSESEKYFYTSRIFATVHFWEFLRAKLKIRRLLKKIFFKYLRQSI